MGADGSGKADVHMVSLALKTLRKEPRDNGSIRIFGESSSETSITSIRKATVSLFKEGKLFSGTVRENIDYERSHISDEAMIKTLHWLQISKVLNPDQLIKKELKKEVLAPFDMNASQIMNKDSYDQFTDFIFDTRNGSSTMDRSEELILRNYLELPVQPNGENFEESQRKIILVARALLKQPDILFMDEGAIDVPDLDDKYYLEALFEHLKNTTIVTTLNNFDYLNKFDYVYWFKDGEIVEEGEPKELLERDDSILSKSFRRTNKKLYRFIRASMGIKEADQSLASKLRKRDKSQPKDEKLLNMLQVMFTAYDDDGSGTLEREEIGKLINDTCVELGIPEPDNDEVDEMIKFYDDSGDGKFDFDEVYDMIAPFVEDQME